MKEQTKILLVRHGQTEWNVQNRLQGHKNSPLTNSGKMQALDVKRVLDSYEIHGAYVSPLQRAKDTIEIILSDLDIEAIEVHNLKEINLGPWEGKTKEETKKSHPEEYANFWSKQDEFSLHGAETYSQLQNRIVSELKTIISKETNKTILVVSHWIAIKVAVAYFSSIPISQLSSVPDIENGGFFTLIKEGNTISVKGL